MNYKDYLKSPEWAIVARQAKKRAGYRCQLCNEAGQLHAHHRTYERLGDENDADVVVLCSSCHAKFHDKLKSIRDEWLATVANTKPIFYNCVVGQTVAVELDRMGDIWLMFGSNTPVELLGQDGQQMCGRTMRMARTLKPSI